MAALEHAIYHHLKDNTTGVIVATRIYRAGETPQSVLEHTQEWVTYQRISTPRPVYQGGVSGLANPRFQFDCWAPTPKRAKALADAVRADFATQTGATGETGNKVTIKSAEVVDERHDITPEQDASQRVLHRYSVDILFWQSE